MSSGYDHRSLDDLDDNPHKPTPRYEISKALDVTGYNLNIAVLEPGKPLSQTHYHAHQDQEEFYYVFDGRCRVEFDDESFDLVEDDVIVIREGTPHLLHNPYDESCRLVAIGSPPEGRYPVIMYDNYDNVLDDRYEGE